MILMSNSVRKLRLERGLPRPGQAVGGPNAADLKVGSDFGVPYPKSLAASRYEV